MLTKEYLFYWTTQLKVCNACYCIPYEYDSKAEKVKVLNTKISRRIYYSTIFTHLVYFVIMCFHMCLNYKSWTLANCLKALVVIGIFAICAVCRLTFFWNETEGLKLLNWFLNFENHLLRHYPHVNTKGSTLTKIVFWMGSSTCSTFVFLIFILLMNEPCSPPYSRSMMSACFEERPEDLNLFIKLVTVTFDASMYSLLAQPTALFIGNVFYGLSICFQKYLSILTSLTEEMKSSEKELLKVFRLYRCVQLLENQFNITCRSFFLPGILFVTSNTLIFTFYVCIKLHSEIPMPGFAFFPMVLSDAIMIIGIEFAAAGFVNKDSKTLVEKWRKLAKVHRKKSGVKAYTNAMTNLKIRFGMNYIDELSSLTILDFCANQTASLMLMSD